MKELEEAINTAESVLDREQGDLSQARRQHHTDWDNHILTLSTASIGFIFAFLPIASSNYFYLVSIGIFSFILSICFAAANYIFSDIGFNYAFECIIKNRKLNINLKQKNLELDKALSKSKNENDENIYLVAKETYNKDVNKLINEADFEKEIENREVINKKITFLNHAKTYTFISGILFIVIFSLLNIESFTK